MVGFGVKAGMLPLHIWLPKAHPVAPSPASALLSAIMIKAGAYGFIRVLLTILTPMYDEALWIYPQQFGYLFLWIGASTMVIGGIMALLNSSMKKILAYSSISQMGYILFSLGIGAFLGSRGAFGFAGAWMHMINHVFYKSFLFLLVGAVYLQTHELDINKLGGLRKAMPWAFVFTLVAAVGITGVPGFNGYVSKVLIHEAILEAYHIKHWPSLLWLERIFIITGGITVAYITKLWLTIFGGKENSHWEKVHDISIAHRAVFAVYSIVLLVVGVFAQPIVNRLVVPAAAGYNFYGKDIAHLAEVPFWHTLELLGPVIAYAIGLFILMIWTRYGKHILVPVWLSVEALVYRQVTRNSIAFIYWISELHLPQVSPAKFKDKHEYLENQRELLITKGRIRAKAINLLNKKRVTLSPRIKVKIRTKVEERQSEVIVSTWNTQNLSFDSLIVALVIALTLLLFLLVGL